VVYKKKKGFGLRRKKKKKKKRRDGGASEKENPPRKLSAYLFRLEPPVDDRFLWYAIGETTPLSSAGPAPSVTPSVSSTAAVLAPAADIEAPNLPPLVTAAASDGLDLDLDFPLALDFVLDFTLALPFAAAAERGGGEGDEERAPAPPASAFPPVRPRLPPCLPSARGAPP